MREIARHVEPRRYTDAARSSLPVCRSYTKPDNVIHVSLHRRLRKPAKNATPLTPLLGTKTMSSTQFMPGGTIHLYRHDLPEGLSLGPLVAVDTETMGLNPQRDRLCL